MIGIADCGRIVDSKFGSRALRALDITLIGEAW
jgi:hypothetical protein